MYFLGTTEPFKWNLAQTISKMAHCKMCLKRYRIFKYFTHMFPIFPSRTLSCRMRSIIPTAHNSDSPLLRQPITPTAHFSDNAKSTNPWFNQYIQQDVPSVRLILTDHGLDRMFWKGKGAFILGCTSPFKEIMIDRPGIGKVKNWRKSCAHCTKNQKRGVKEKSVNREKHEKDKMTEDNNTHGSEES